MMGLARPGMDCFTRAFICLALMVLPLKSSGTEIHYKDGKTYFVQMSHGAPASYTDKDIEGVRIFPAIGRSDSDQLLSLCWLIEIDGSKKGRWTLDVEPDNDSTSAFKADCFFWGEHHPHRLTQFIKNTGSGEEVVSLMPPFGFQPKAPGLWTWLDGQGDAWIPFKVHLHSVEDAKDIRFIQWVRMTDGDRSRARWWLNEFRAKDAGDLIKIRDLQGHPMEVRAIRGYPVFLRTPMFCVKGLGPSVAKGADGHPVFAWALDGVLSEKTAADIVITLADFPDVPPQKARTNGTDHFRVVTADSIRFPRVWKWLQSPGDTWLRFLIHIDEGPGKSQEGEQWVLVSSHDKKQVGEALKAQGYR